MRQRAELRASEAAAGRRLGRRGTAALTVLLLAGTGLACRQDMHDQPRFEPLEANDFFADGMASRPVLEGTVARGQLRADRALYDGKDEEDRPLAVVPLPLTRELLTRGRERYDIFCAPCHGRLGDGKGMVVQRGFKQPPSFHQNPLKSQPVGYYFDVMSNGFGVMSSYASQVRVEDRWAIAAYVRALQLSQAIPLAELPAADQEAVARLGGETGSAPAPGHDAGGH